MKRRYALLLSILLLVVCSLSGCVLTSLRDVNVELLEKESVHTTEQESIKALESLEEVVPTETEGRTEAITTEEPTTEETTTEEATTLAPETESQTGVVEDGSYTSKEEVAEYLHLFGHLPENFITKKEAKELGWVSSEGNLWEVAPGMSIGGDYFGNYEGNLPEKKGRKYYECDIDTDGSYRGAKRIVFSNDGLIYYTEDHYENFELLYGKP